MGIFSGLSRNTIFKMYVKKEFEVNIKSEH